jgi:hypothetical protein
VSSRSSCFAWVSLSTQYLSIPISLKLSKRLTGPKLPIIIYSKIKSMQKRKLNKNIVAWIQK